MNCRTYSDLSVPTAEAASPNLAHRSPSTRTTRFGVLGAFGMRSSFRGVRAPISVPELAVQIHLVLRCICTRKGATTTEAAPGRCYQHQPRALIGHLREQEHRPMAQITALSEGQRITHPA